MKLMDMLVIGGLAALVLTRTSQAASATDSLSPSTPGPVQAASEPIVITTPAPVASASIQDTLASIIQFAQSGGRFRGSVPSQYLFNVPTNFPQLRGTAANQYTGNTTGEYDLTFQSGTVRFLPYDPRQTKTELNALIDSARRAMVNNPVMQAEYRTLGDINASWSRAYQGVI